MHMSITLSGNVMDVFCIHVNTQTLIFSDIVLPGTEENFAGGHCEDCCMVHSSPAELFVPTSGPTVC